MKTDKIEMAGMSKEQAQDLVGRIVNTVQPRRVILFGSAARGDTNPHSDIDVLVVVDDGIHRRKTAQQIYRAMLGFGLPVDVVVATIGDLEQYKDSPSLVYHHALREGKELYAA